MEFNNNLFRDISWSRVGGGGADDGDGGGSSSSSVDVGMVPSPCAQEPRSTYVQFIGSMKRRKARALSVQLYCIWYYYYYYYCFVWFMHRLHWNLYRGIRIASHKHKFLSQTCKAKEWPGGMHVYPYIRMCICVYCVVPTIRIHECRYTTYICISIRFSSS